MAFIASHIEAFLREYLVRHRGNSKHTCESYAYSFRSLFQFASQRLKMPPSSIALEQLDAALICSFLEYLETVRGNSGNTRNIRLAAIRSFFRFLQHREPAALLDAPNPATRNGIRDRAMLHLAISGGLRVSELTGLRIDDIAPQSASIRVFGKGRRERALPLWKTTASALRAWLAIRGVVVTPEVFVNARGEPFSRWGIAYVLRHHAQTATKKCNSLVGKQLSPHVLRHTCAMIMLQATQDIRKVSLWLGHSNLATTEVYVRADPSEKLEAIEAVVPPHLRKGRFRAEDKLIALLKAKL
jgi:site-specific recombinase XerD